MPTHTWNVYKIFANGKRAKFPMQSFEFADETLAFEFFMSKIKPTFTAKQQKSKYTLVRSDLSQDRIENIHSHEDLISKKRAKVIRKHMELAQKTPLFHKNLQFGLLFATETDFKWQWCAMEAGTSRFLSGISPKFAKHGDAIEWVDSKFDE